MNLYLTLLSGVLAGFATASFAATACTAPLTQQKAVTLQTQLLDAMSHEDKVAFNSLTTDDLILHERGKVYDRDGLFAIATGAHRAGTRIVWHVTEPQVTSDCRLAVMSYLDSGSIQPRGQDVVPVRWLETAAYRKEGDAWRVFLLTSERLAGMESAGAQAPSAAASTAPAR